MTFETYSLTGNVMTYFVHILATELLALNTKFEICSPLQLNVPPTSSKCKLAETEFLSKTREIYVLIAWYIVSECTVTCAASNPQASKRVQSILNEL